MENVNGINSVWGVLHCDVNPGGSCNEPNGLGARRPCPTTRCQAGFHTYRLEWDRRRTPNELRWYVDGLRYHQVRQDQISRPAWSRMTAHRGYFLLLNLAIGGAFPNALAGRHTPIPATVPGRSMLVDYITVSTWRQ